MSNLGSRERTRQEVLFEIIQSEERYVHELAKMKDSFIDPLLHPFASASSTPVNSSTPNLDFDYDRSDSPAIESSDQLPPIAARFMSPTPSQNQRVDADTIDSDEDTDEVDERNGKSGTPTNKMKSAAEKHNHPRSPYRGTPSSTRTAPGVKSVPFPSGARSHHSLPVPPPRTQLSASTHSLGRQSVAERTTSSPSKKQQSNGMLRKFKKSDATGPLGDVVSPNLLPEDLRICLQVIDGGVLDGHKRLSEGLKKRYDDQYPLVRSLADVFVFNVSLAPSAFPSMLTISLLVRYFPWVCDIRLTS